VESTNLNNDKVEAGASGKEEECATGLNSASQRDGLLECGLRAHLGEAEGHGHGSLAGINRYLGELHVHAGEAPDSHHDSKEDDGEAEVGAETSEEDDLQRDTSVSDCSE
jgi:hypothetical protein